MRESCGALRVGFSLSHAGSPRWGGIGRGRGSDLGRHLLDRPQPHADMEPA